MPAAVQTALNAGGTAALKGMPGIGKTQIALAHAQQYRQGYAGAESLYQRTLAIMEKTLPDDHPLMS